MFDNARHAARGTRIAITTVAMLTAAMAVAAYAQDLCPHKLVDRDLIVNMEGSTINAQHSRARIDIEWRHHEELQQDTFFIHLPGKPSFKYITGKTDRYLEYDSPKIRRQMAMHHLREDIGNTAVKYDDLELIAHGSFLCKDSLVQKPTIFSPAFSNMWWSVASDTLPQPHLVTMRGAGKEKRELRIDSWKDFSGITMPALVTVVSLNYHGKFWIRSVYPIEELQHDPLLEKLQKSNGIYRTFLWIGNEKNP